MGAAIPEVLPPPARASGHLFEAEDESQTWPDLHYARQQAVLQHDPSHRLLGDIEPQALELAVDVAVSVVNA